MRTENFIKLIQAITGRDFLINTNDLDIQFAKKYQVYRVLPLTERKVYFEWVTPLNVDKLLRSFITAYTSKYREPNPKSYDYMVKTYGEKSLWINKTDLEKEYAYFHHSGFMYSKKTLLEQIESNFSNPVITDVLIRHGFYCTEYGIGIYALWQTKQVIEAINKMHSYLQSKAMPYKNEYSDAGWVFRFKLSLTKLMHLNILSDFSTTIA